MADEVLFRTLVENVEGLAALAGDDDEALAELLAVLRYRLMFGTNPDESELTIAAPLVRIELTSTGKKETSTP
jgi:hypothetical protein